MATSSVEDFLVLCLSDSNLPTGGFVASSGLESFTTHGFARGSGKNAAASALLQFVQESLQSYAQLVLGFINDVWTIARSDADPDTMVSRIFEIDRLHHASLSSEIARRASKAQGAALLGLYARSFAASPNSQKPQDILMSRLKQLALNQKSEFQSHLPICWAALCAALDISLEKTRHLHLFLHARSILSAAIRLNLVGPYLAHRLLAMDVKSRLDAALVNSTEQTTGRLSSINSRSTFTNWLASERKLQSQQDQDTTVGPATTWPLQDIVLARHDSLHSRIFNS